MDINELLFLGDENIEYGRLSERLLFDLAIAEDPAVASSALREMKRRSSDLFAQAVTDLLASSATDPHLRADVMELSFAVNPSATLRLIEQGAPSFDSIAWGSLIEIMTTESIFFFQHREASCALYERFRSLDLQPSVDQPLLDVFVSTYSALCR